MHAFQQGSDILCVIYKVDVKYIPKTYKTLGANQQCAHVTYL